MNIAYGLIMCVACEALLMPGWASGRPQAEVCKLDLSTIEVDGESISLDTAYCFRVWNGAKPDYPSSEDGNLANLRKYLEETGDVIRLAYLDWAVDFVVKFDRDIQKGEVVLYGQLNPLFPNWVDFGDISGVPALSANEELRLLNVDFVTYGLALEMLESFNCGASSQLYGTTITVELRLYNPCNPNDHVTLGSCNHKFMRQSKGNWFDAHVEDYLLWPDCVAMAFGGYWMASRTLEDVAYVEGKGRLMLDTEVPIEFIAEESIPVGNAKREVAIDMDIGFGACDVKDLPDAVVGSKGGIALVRDGAVCRYYAMAKVGESNAWVRLEGPVSSDEHKICHVKTLLWNDGRGMMIKYLIDGVEYAYGGRSEIPIVASEPVSRVSCEGVGALGSLFASWAKKKCGMVFYLK